MAPEAWRNNRGAAPRGVHMEPQARLPAESPDLGQWIDHPGGRRSRVGYDHERQESLLTILGHTLLEIFDIHSQAGVCRDCPQTPPSKPGNMRKLVVAVMRLACQIDR